jgi:hypothetical protein
MFSSFGIEEGEVIHFESVQMTLRRLENELKSTILIYGSVARHGCGHDLDMIIVGTEEMWQEFKYRVLNHRSGWGGAVTRHCIVHEMLGEPFDAIDDDGIILVGVYIFPPDWLKRLDELQAAFPHEDPNFMRNIATDVKTLGECAIQAARMS